MEKIQYSETWIKETILEISSFIFLNSFLRIFYLEYFFVVADFRFFKVSSD